MSAAAPGPRPGLRRCSPLTTPDLECLRQHVTDGDQAFQRTGQIPERSFAGDHNALVQLLDTDLCPKDGGERFARKGVRELDLPDSEAKALGGRAVARRGRKPKSSA
jgi:hypothetical protein